MMNCSKGVMRAALVGLALLAVTGAQAATSLADAKSKIAEALASSAKMEQTVKSLAAADQKAFVAAVNTAINALPGKASAKTAKYVAANQALVKGADKAAVNEVIAEVFATVPVEALPALSEAFAANLFNRDASKLDDAAFTKVSEKVVKAVSARAAKADDGDVRAAFAIVTFAKASKGSPANLTETLVKALPADAQKKAAADWIPAAQKGNYETILAAADVSVDEIGKEASEALAGAMILRSPAPSILDVMAAERMGVNAFSAANNPNVYAQPLDGLDNSVPLPEPIGYYNQR